MRSLPPFADRLNIPVIAAPMFLVSGADLVVESCRAGVIGGFPALNCRTTAEYGTWLEKIESAVSEHDAPFAVNLIVHRSNKRLAADLNLTIKRRVPIVITSLGVDTEIVAAVQGYGGVVFHDVISRRHAEKAASAGVDGIIGVCAGAGGHTGSLSPFAMLAEIRAVYDGLVILAGGMTSGSDIAAATAMGADLVAMGTRFIATQESLAAPGYKDMLIEATAADIVSTDALTGVKANFLRQSLSTAGVDLEQVSSTDDLGVGNASKVWRDIWSAGHGVATIRDIPTTRDLCNRLVVEYLRALRLDPRFPRQT